MINPTPLKRKTLSWQEIDEQMKYVSPESKVAYQYLKALYIDNPWDRRDNQETVY